VKPAWIKIDKALGLSPAQDESDPNRRYVSGNIVEVSGVSGVAAGFGEILFARTAVAVMLGTIANPFVVDYDDTLSLQIAGRGELRHSSGGGWIGGGFGLKGAAKGVLTAGVLNALTTSKSTTIETIVKFEWNSGHVVLLHNTFFLPNQLAAILGPAVARIEDPSADEQASLFPPDAEQDSSAEDPLDKHPGVTDELKDLARLHRSGELTDDEFAAAKARLLGTPRGDS
jgi:hypothetical protein